MKFTTSVVGSFPRSKTLIDTFNRYNKGQAPKDELDLQIDHAIQETIEEEEKIGLDVITDGEQGRVSFVTFVGQKIPGMQMKHISEVHPDALKILKQLKTHIPYTRAIPVERLPDDVVLTIDELERIRKYSSKPVKITLPSPYLLMWETWHKKLSGPVYREPEELGYVYAKLIRQELVRLRDKGVSTVQIDEPMIGNLLEATPKEPDRYRRIFGILNEQEYRGFKEELELAIDMVNKAVEGIKDLHISMHICHWPNADSPFYGVGVERFLDGLFDINVNQLVLEYATPGSGDPIELVKHYPQNLQIGYGVIDVRNKKIETVDGIITKVRKISDYIDPERIWLNPDCGYAPGMRMPFPRDVAFAKVKSMVDAAAILRREY